VNTISFDRPGYMTGGILIKRNCERVIKCADDRCMHVKHHENDIMLFNGKDDVKFRRHVAYLASRHCEIIICDIR